MSVSDDDAINEPMQALEDYIGDLLKPLDPRESAGDEAEFSATAAARESSEADVASQASVPDPSTDARLTPETRSPQTAPPAPTAPAAPSVPTVSSAPSAAASRIGDGQTKVEKDAIRESSTAIPKPAVVKPVSIESARLASSAKPARTLSHTTGSQPDSAAHAPLRHHPRPSLTPRAQAAPVAAPAPKKQPDKDPAESAKVQALQLRKELTAPVELPSMLSEKAEAEAKARLKARTDTPSAPPVTVPVTTPEADVPEPAPAPAEQIEDSTAIVTTSATAEAPAQSVWLENGRPEWGQGPFECLMFKVGGLTLSVPLVELGSIHPIGDGDLTPIFGQVEWFMGLTAVNGVNIRTVDTAKVVMPERYQEAMKDDYHYIISIADVDWGLAVDSVSESITLHPDDIRWRGTRSQRPWLAGTVVEHMCALLDVAALSTMFWEMDKNSPGKHES